MVVEKRFQRIKDGAVRGGHGVYTIIHSFLESFEVDILVRIMIHFPEFGN